MAVLNIDLSACADYAEFEAAFDAAQTYYFTQRVAEDTAHYRTLEHAATASPNGFGSSATYVLALRCPWVLGAPFVPSAETILSVAQQKLAAKKELRARLVSNIVVEVSPSVFLDGDENSQTRMTRALSSLPDDEMTIPWVCADKSVTMLTRPMLRLALMKAGQEQTRLWNIY